MIVAEEALTFDDVLLVPNYSEVLPRDVSLCAQLTRQITMNIPVVSAAMDTVTESGLAIALAQEGGIGIIHKNMSPELQAKNVRRVKKFETGVIKEPLTVGPYTSIREVMQLTAEKNISPPNQDRFANRLTLRRNSESSRPTVCLDCGRASGHSLRCFAYMLSARTTSNSSSGACPRNTPDNTPEN